MGTTSSCPWPSYPQALLFFLFIGFWFILFIFLLLYADFLTLHHVLSWQVKEKSFKIDQIVTDFSWMIGLQGYILPFMLSFIFYNGYVMILLSEKTTTFLKWHIVWNVPVLGINYRSTLGFTEYITPKNQSSFF